VRALVGLLLALVLAVPAAAQTGRVSAGNSTTALLGSGATYTGAWEDATQAAVVVVTIKADQASATNGVKVEFSSDCSNQDFVTTHSFTDTVNGQSFADATAAKCVRVEYVNGASGQGTFRLQTVVRDSGFGGTSAGGTASSVTINDPTITTQKWNINASGQGSVTCANCSGSGASAVDRAPFTFGTNSIAPSGGIFDDTPPTDLTAGMAGIVRMTPKRAFHVQLRNQAGTEVGTSTTPLQVTGANGTFQVTGTFFQATQPVSLAAAVDVSDRAGRLVGVVYGSQAQQLKQTATNFNLQSELAVGGTLIDPRDVSDRSGRALGSIANLFLLDATFTGRMPAGASPANAESNTNASLSRIGGYTFIFNGTTWDRWTGAISGTVTTTPPANASTNVAQFGGSAVATGTGVGGAGIPRVTLSSDSSLAANQSVNVAQINGVTPLMGAGATGTGAPRVNDVSSSATGAAPPASASYIAGLCSGATGGFLCGVTVGDTNKAINISSATTTLMITGVASRQVHIAAFHLITAAANNVAWIEGTGATCGTGTAGMAGGTTAASGYNLAANGGIAQGVGFGDVLATTTSGDSVCLVTSAATQLSGFIKYAIY
jgi:hypothetical protein